MDGFIVAEIAISRSLNSDFKADFASLAFEPAALGDIQTSTPFLEAKTRLSVAIAT